MTATAIVATAVRPPGCLAQSEWTFGLGAGIATPLTYRTYSYSFGDYPEQFGAGSMILATAGGRLGQRFDLWLTAGYLGYEKQLGLGYIPEVYPPESRLRAQFLSWGTGVRYSPGRTPGGLRPYCEVVPTLFLSRWKERDEYSTDPDGRYAPRTVETDSFSRLLPGFQVGVGLVGPLLDVGFRFIYCANAGEEGLGTFGSGDFRGLRQLGLVAILQSPL